MSMVPDWWPFVVLGTLVIIIIVAITATIWVLSQP